MKKQKMKIILFLILKKIKFNYLEKIKLYKYNFKKNIIFANYIFICFSSQLLYFLKNKFIQIISSQII